jgi:hypothetical protein
MTAPVVQKLAVHAAARQRGTDEHMYTVACDEHRMGTFRLQLFTAVGARPVAIATQTAGEGASLTNRAEEYAADVWRRHFPGLAEPPVWIELQLFPGIPGHPERFTLVTFSGGQPHELTGPGRCRMSDADVARLVGAAGDRDRRGDGYQPWSREPEELPVYQVAWVGLLPRPDGVDRGCMNGPPPWQLRLGRQLVPRRSTRDCCYYHSVSWQQVSAAAIRIWPTPRTSPSGAPGAHRAARQRSRHPDRARRRRPQVLHQRPPPHHRDARRRRPAHRRDPLADARGRGVQPVAGGSTGRTVLRLAPVSRNTSTAGCD